MLETLIRELVSTAANPIYYKMNAFNETVRSVKDDFSLFADKFREYDKRLHQCVEYCREKCDDNSVLKKEDLERLKIDVEDKVIHLTTQLTKLRRKCESLDDQQTQNDLVVDTVKADSFRALENTAIRLKDYIAKEMLSV